MSMMVRDRRVSGHSRGLPLSVWLVTGSLGLVAAVLCATALRSLAPASTAVHVPWWALVLLFACCESFVVHFHVGRETQAFSLGEIPLVVGLAFVNPLLLVAARIVGALIVLPLQRRQTPIKIAFNLALFALEAAVAVVAFHLLLGRSPISEPGGWMAVFVAVNFSALIGTVAVVSVMTLHQRSFRPHWRRQVLLPALGSFANTNFGIVGVLLLATDARAGWLLLVVAAMVFIGYRSYTSLADRHHSLQLLQNFTSVVGGSLDAGETTQSLLDQVRQLLGADAAELVVRDGGDHYLRMSLEPGRDVVTVEGRFADLDPVTRQVAEGGEAVLVPRGERRRESRSVLEARDWPDAIVAPFRGSSVAGALLVGRRLGDVATFTADDLQILSTIANHASILLENSRLVERLRAEVQEKEYQASHDVLTSLANRTLFSTKLATAVAAATPEHPVAVMLLDLDRFKEVNDTLGHHTGDLLLQHVARRLSTVIPEAEVIARLGGDEFAVLVRDTDRGAAVAQALRAADAISEPFVVSDLELFVGASIGIALAPEHGTTAEALLQRADVAMYGAKTERTGCEVYASDRDRHSHRRLALAGELRGALDAGDLAVHYQPKVLIDTHHVLGFEALVRWRHGERGYIPPNEFIELAEHTGLIRPLTWFVLREALHRCRTWRGAGRDVGVAVNLSAAVLLAPDLMSNLRAALHEARVPATALTLEITESTVSSDHDRVVTALQEITDMGVRLSLDDFGTGYSSLAHLKRLPVTELKIDRSFVSGLLGNDDDALIVRSIIDLGRNLERTVVAEGVEDAQTLARLRSLGCDVAQGFHLAHPMPAQQVADWLGAWERNNSAMLTSTSG